MKSYTLSSESPESPTAPRDPIDVVSEQANADIFLFSSGISYASGEAFIDMISENRKRENVILILSTYGGDPDAAYRIARFLQDHYKRFSLHIYGFCKSAGTLLALGANDIVMGDRAEFGPLDVQLHKPDEFMHRVSGLDITKALASISDSAWEAFQNCFLSVRARSGGVITTKTASEIAAQVITGLFSPITQNIDPLKLGEMQRSMDIAVDYGMRLGASRELATTLAANYPHHGFVIDFAESKRLFNCVRHPNEAEMELAVQLVKFFETSIDEDVIRHPSPEGVIAYIQPSEIKTNEDSSHASNGTAPIQESDQPRDVSISPSNDHNGGRPSRKAAKKKQEAQQDGGEQPATRS
ncbi:MAG: hypothetical protein EAZ42_02035 [Verrucomicrobia bacterium]|nr:MAG: hypothetical protein EAZ42_02035 [Verrucomicrobiota bacterium]